MEIIYTGNKLLIKNNEGVLLKTYSFNTMGDRIAINELYEVIGSEYTAMINNLKEIRASSIYPDKLYMVLDIARSLKSKAHNRFLDKVNNIRQYMDFDSKELNKFTDYVLSLDKRFILINNIIICYELDIDIKKYIKDLFNIIVLKHTNTIDLELATVKVEFLIDSIDVNNYVDYFNILEINRYSNVNAVYKRVEECIHNEIMEIITQCKRNILKGNK